MGHGGERPQDVGAAAVRWGGGAQGMWVGGGGGFGAAGKKREGREVPGERMTPIPPHDHHPFPPPPPPLPNSPGMYGPMSEHENKPLTKSIGPFL
jgi:hypothetical protein